MAAAKRRVPDRAVNRKDKKQVRYSAESTQRRLPAWRFSTVDLNGPFSWPVNQPQELTILQRLRDFDTMHWSELETKQHHAISVDQLSKEARDRLLEIKQDDVDEVFSFRCSARERIIGIRINDIVKLLWWDPDHQVCPSFKKHT